VSFNLLDNVVGGEFLNGKLWDELLRREIFATLEEARVLVEKWKREYNHVRPHGTSGC
jgi:putative transposase